MDQWMGAVELGVNTVGTLWHKFPRGSELLMTSDCSGISNQVPYYTSAIVAYWMSTLF